MQKVRILLYVCVLLSYGSPVVIGQPNPASLPPVEVPGKDQLLNSEAETQLGVAERTRGFSGIMSGSITSGGGKECYVWNHDGRVAPGACYESLKGPEKPFDHKVALTSHSMVANSLEDRHFADQILGSFLTTPIGNAFSAFMFANPAAGQVLQAGLEYSHWEAMLCQQTHIHYMADLASGPEGDANVKAYLGCIRKYVDVNPGGTNPQPQLDGQPKGPLCQAIAACQGDRYLPVAASGGGSSNVLPAELFAGNPETAFVPTDNECHPDNPRLKWVDPYDSATPALRAKRLLFSDLLFCEYHQTRVTGTNGFACQPARIGSTRSDTDKSPEKIACDTGLAYEQFMKQYVGNFALMRTQSATPSHGVVSTEWQSVAPYTLNWPPSGGRPKPAPEVYSLYRAGETFTYLMQMMTDASFITPWMESQEMRAQLNGS